MAYKSYRQESKKDYGVSGVSEFANLNIDQLQIGALLRIADASEKMAVNIIDLQNKLKRTEESLAWSRKRVAYLEKANAALRGHIKRLKRK